jgi:hypothetical protein
MDKVLGLSSYLQDSNAPAPTGALPNVLSKEPFSVKNREAGAVFEEPQFIASLKQLRLLLWSPSREVLPNTPFVTRRTCVRVKMASTFKKNGFPFSLG